MAEKPEEIDLACVNVRKAWHITAFLCYNKRELAEGKRTGLKKLFSE